MARAEFEAFTQSLLMNYRRTAARADPPRARCLEVKEVEPGSLAEKILLAPGDLLVSMNGQSAATLSPKLWRLTAKIREYIFYSPQTRERIELTTTGVDLGCELKRTTEMIQATYKPEVFDPDPLMELWEAGAWPALLPLATAAARKHGEATPIYPIYGAALYETGKRSEAVAVMRNYLEKHVRNWTVNYRGIATFYMGLEKANEGDLNTAGQVLALAYADLPVDRIANAVAELGFPRPLKAVVWAGKAAPGDYELETLEGPKKTVTMSEALLGLKDGHILLLCLLSGYRGNGPYNEFMQRYLTLIRDFTPFIGPLHVITEVEDRYPDRPHYFEAEDKCRAGSAPFDLLFDPQGEVSAMYEPTVSPFVLTLNNRGLILTEGQLEGMEVWRALVAANR